LILERLIRQCCEVAADGNAVMGTDRGSVVVESI